MIKVKSQKPDGKETADKMHWKLACKIDRQNERKRKRRKA